MATLTLTIPEQSQNIQGVAVIRTLSTYQTVADRDGMVQSGMEAGWRQGLEAMEKLLNK